MDNRTYELLYENASYFLEDAMTSCLKQHFLETNTSGIVGRTPLPAYVLRDFRFQKADCWLKADAYQESGQIKDIRIYIRSSGSDWQIEGIVSMEDGWNFSANCIKHAKYVDIATNSLPDYKIITGDWRQAMRWITFWKLNYGSIP